MEKLTYNKFAEIMREHNNKHGKGVLYGVIVIDNKSFDVEYPFESRAYVVTSEANHFNPRISYSLFGTSLDYTDRNVRLDWYIRSEWKVEYCYFLTADEVKEIEQNWSNNKNYNRPM